MTNFTKKTLGIFTKTYDKFYQKCWTNFTKNDDEFYKKKKKKNFEKNYQTFVKLYQNF